MSEASGGPDDAGGRIFFSNLRRSLEIEDEIELTSVGVDIGSSTSHLVFSRLLLERLDNRYIVSRREVLHQSDVLLTPYAADGAIDTGALGAFIAEQYARASLTPDGVDTGVLILTGVAVRRRNARAVADLFAADAGKFVSVSAGDSLESTLAAFGSGATALSVREAAQVMNIDIGGGTSKVALCDAGTIVDHTALDIGARVLSFDAEGLVTRVEESARVFARELAITVEVGRPITTSALDALADRMAERLFEAVSAPVLSTETHALVRLDPLINRRPPDVVIFSGGVSEYIYGRESSGFGDLGPRLARAIHRRVAAWGPRIAQSDQGIRATVVGASQYTIQVSGSTIFVSPLEVLPLRNIPAITPAMPLAPDELDAGHIAAAVTRALRQHDLDGGEQAVAVCYHWEGAATYARLDATVRGVAEGLAPALARGQPMILVGDGDVGGLLGIHARMEANISNAIVSIDGVTLRPLDFVDIGAMMELSGAVPVVIKSLVFPTSAAVGAATGTPTRPR